MTGKANYKNKKTILCAYNNSCILQLSICQVTIMHTDKQKPCRFLVVPVGWSALLGMPGVEML